MHIAHTKIQATTIGQKHKHFAMHMFFLIIGLFYATYASAADLYRIADGVSQVVNEHGVCYTVRNNTGQELLVPTKTAAEWSTFVNSGLIFNSDVVLTTCGVLCSTPSTAKVRECSGKSLANTFVPSGDFTACHNFCQTVAGATCCSEVSGACRATDGGYVSTFNTQAKSVLCSSTILSCSQGGLALANVDYTDFYEDSLSCGGNCSSIVQQRTCSGGTLLGSAAHTEGTCPKADDCLDCTLDDITVPHGDDYTFYSEATPACGTTCASVGQSRTCTDGEFDGSSTYNLASCTESTDCATCFTPWLSGNRYNCFGSVVGSTSGLSATGCLNFCENLPGVGCCKWLNSGGLCNAHEGGPSESVSSWLVTSCSNTVPVDCMLDGVTIPHGGVRDFYLRENPSCPDNCNEIDQSRQCVNGYLTGDPLYRWATCNEPVGCGNPCAPVNGIQLNHGESYRFYSTNETACGTTCNDESQVRTCNNGELSGDSIYNLATCLNPTGCGIGCAAVDGITLEDGESHTFYTTSSPSCGDTCADQGQERTCNNGVLTGSASYNTASCSEPTSCGASCDTVGGVSVADGSSHTFYTQSNPTCGTTCAAISQSRTCTDGVLDGSVSYNQGSCIEPTGCGGSSCPPVDGVAVPEGQSRTFYTQSNPACGATCGAISQSRTCSGGVLSGSASYNRSSCSEPVGCDCPAVDDVQLSHTQSHTFYTAGTPACGSTCNDISQTRTCNAGVLSGSSSYDTASCSEPTGCDCAPVDDIQLDHGESYDFYTTSSPACGSTCDGLKQRRTCIAGTLTGSASYNRASCSNPVGCCAPQNVTWFQLGLCSANSGETIGHGDTIVVTDNEDSPFGEAIFSCNNGNLDVATTICCSPTCETE